MNLELNTKEDFKRKFKKRCFQFSISLLQFTDKLRTRRINWIIIDQLIRSGTSIGANIVEGSNASSRREFINYFQIALKSSAETLYWLALLKELNQEYLNQIDKLMEECNEIKKILSTIILNTKNYSKF